MPPSAWVCPHRKNYEALCQMYQKIQPLLENLHRNFIETRNNISEPRRVGWARQRGGLEALLPGSSYVMSVPWFLGATLTHAANFAGSISVSLPARLRRLPQVAQQRVSPGVCSFAGCLHLFPSWP